MIRLDDPILALKFAALFACMAFIFWILCAIAKTMRVVNHKLIMSNFEAALVIMLFVFSMCVPVCLIWSVLAWIF